MALTVLLRLSNDVYVLWGFLPLRPNGAPILWRVVSQALGGTRAFISAEDAHDAIDFLSHPLTAYEKRLSHILSLPPNAITSLHRARAA